MSPPGACNEWLRKIVEVNPDFQVLTFMDEVRRHTVLCVPRLIWFEPLSLQSCQSVFVKDVQ